MNKLLSHAVPREMGILDETESFSLLFFLLKSNRIVEGLLGYFFPRKRRIGRFADWVHPGDARMDWMKTAQFKLSVIYTNEEGCRFYACPVVVGSR